MTRSRHVQYVVAEAILAGGTISDTALGVKRSSLHRIAQAATMPRRTPFARPITYDVTPEAIMWAQAILTATRTSQETRELRRAAQRETQQRDKVYVARSLPIREPTPAALRAACVAVSALVAEGHGEIDPVTHRLDPIALARAAKEHGLVLVDVLAMRWEPRGKMR
jgi:hypothetical protein